MLRAFDEDFNLRARKCLSWTVSKIRSRNWPDYYFNTTQKLVRESAERPKNYRENFTETFTEIFSILSVLIKINIKIVPISFQFNKFVLQVFNACVTKCNCRSYITKIRYNVCVV